MRASQRGRVRRGARLGGCRDEAVRRACRSEPRRAGRPAGARSGCRRSCRALPGRAAWPLGSSLIDQRRACEAAVEAGLGGPDGDAEDAGRLCEWQAEVEVQHDDRALVDGQPAELPLEAVALRDGPSERRGLHRHGRRASRAARPRSGAGLSRAAGSRPGRSGDGARHPTHRGRAGRAGPARLRRAPPGPRPGRGPRRGG